MLHARTWWIAVLLLFGQGVWGVPAAAQEGRSLWTDLPAPAALRAEDAGPAPSSSRTLALDLEGMKELLAQTPVEAFPGDASEGFVLELPLPDGGFAAYRVVESSVMAPGLQARYPSLRTYVGQGVNEPGATLRVSVTPQGFRAVSRRSEGTFYLDPLAPGDRRLRAYWRHDARSPHDAHRHPPERLEEEAEAESPGAALRSASLADEPAAGGPAVLVQNAGTLRTYRTAIAATGEYTRFHSADALNPTVEEGLAAIVEALARVNEIYEREVAVRFVLVEENDRIVHLDPLSDPYSNNSASLMLGQNQISLDSLLGADAYDIGHVFSTGGGGLATVGTVCRGGFKARGATGLQQPTGDPFYIDYVAHEFGHQFAANHSFNGTAGGCGGINRWGPTAYEPGSGSTIMAYAGTCGAHNLQQSSDAYFHAASLVEILRFINEGRGGQCGTVTATGREAPPIAIGGGGAVPVGTPFALRPDPDTSPDALSYTWEGYDLGGEVGSPPPGVDGWDEGPPYFRSTPPSDRSDRLFPRLTSLLEGTASLGEGLPGGAGPIQLSLTVRDNHPGGGGVTVVRVPMTVVEGAGPFRVTAPAGEEVIWLSGEAQTVAWEVAGTDTAELGGELVDILLTTGEGADFEAGTARVLAAGVPNTGAAVVTVPSDMAVSGARVIVRAAAGAFFAVSPSDLTVQTTTPGEASPARAPVVLSPAYPNPAGLGAREVTVVLTLEAGQHVRAVVFDALGREALVLHDGPLASGAHPLPIPVHPLSAGPYFVRVVAERSALVQRFTVVR